MESSLTPSLGSNAHAGAIAQLFQQAYQQAMSMTFADMYLIVAWCSALPLLVVPFIQKSETEVAIAGH
jgi:hypothetical protein